MDGGYRETSKLDTTAAREAGVGAVLQLRETLGAGKKDHGGDVGSPLPLLPQAVRKARRDCEHADRACMCMCVSAYLQVCACMCVSAWV